MPSIGETPEGRRERLEFEIVDSVRRLIAGAILYSHHVADQLKLGPSDAQFLTLLDVHGPLTPGRFAELTGLKTGTVTGVLDRLEKIGLIRRDRDPHDRRKVIVSQDAETVGRLLAPHYLPKGAAMTESLAKYDLDQLALIAEFTKAAEQA